MSSFVTDSLPNGFDLLVEDRRSAKERRTATGASSFTTLPSTSKDDGWWRERATASTTQVFRDNAQSVALHSESNHLAFSQLLSPYRGCEHGCVYCHARPSYARLGLSPCSDFETKIFHKPDAAHLLQRKLSTPGYLCSPIALGAGTDVYQPTERRLELTRRMLEVLYTLKHPATLTSKSALIVRDIDLLAAMARSNLVQVTISLCTLDSELAHKLEPRAATPQARLVAIRRLSEAGIPVRVMFAPAIPGLTDHEMENLLAAAFESGARAASHAVLHLPHELHALFDPWLARHAPGKISRIMSILYNKRGGKGSNPHWDSRMRGLGHFAALLEQRFHLTCRRIGFSDLPELDCSQFCVAQDNQENDAHLITQGVLF